MHVMRCWRSRGSLAVSILPSSLLVLVAVIGGGERKCWACFCLLTDVTTDEWAFSLLPLDEDIISLELPEFFRDNFLVNNVHRVWIELKWIVNYLFSQLTDYFDDWLIVEEEVLYNELVPTMWVIFYYSKLNIFEFRTVDQTKQFKQFNYVNLALGNCDVNILLFAVILI